MRNYTLLHPLVLSFFSRPLYQDVAKRWKGWCILYFLFLLSLYWVPETIKMHEYFSQRIAAEAPHYVEQTPTITVTKGTVSIQEKSPFTIYHRDGATPFAVIDTSAAAPSPNAVPATLVLTKTALILQSEGAESHTFELEGIDRLVIDKKALYGWIASLESWVSLLVFPLALSFSLLFHLAQAAFIASIGGLFARAFNVALDFKALFRLAAVAFTPAVMLQAVHLVFDIEFPYKSLFSFFIALGYLYYAVGANSEAEETATDVTA